MSTKISRRRFLSTSAAALATTAIAGPLAASIKPAASSQAPGSPGIDDFGSKFGGVQIGAITYCWRDQPGGLENIVNYCKQTGINSIELMSGDLEAFLGAPRNRSEIKAFRLGMTPEKIAPARKLFDDAGIGVHIVKFAPSRWSDEEIDYAFMAAKAMGAGAVCDEIGMEAATRMAPFAEKHGMFAILHNHGQYAEPGFSADPFLAVSPAVMLNFDAGHYGGSTGLNPCDFVRKYHDRIYSIHLKDKTGPDTPEPNHNQVWGQGQTPLKELLLLIRQEGWPIYLDIELEYGVKPWSTSVREVKTCVQYARNILI